MRKHILSNTSNVERSLCATESKTESRSVVSNTFRDDMGWRNPYPSKIRRPRPEPTPALVS
jgi:hypothetical protein